MRNEKRNKAQDKRTRKSEGKLKNLSRVLSIVYSVFLICFIVLLIWLNILPAKYMYPTVAALLILSIFVVPVLYSSKGRAGRKKGASVVALFMIILFGVGVYYMSATLNFFGDITSVGESTEDFYLVVEASSKYEEAKELSGKTVGAHAAADLNYNEARKKLTDKLDIEYEYLNELPDLLEELLSGEYSAIFISAASYESMKGQDSSLEQKARIIYIVSIPTERERTTKNVKVTKESFNVMITGLDVEGDIDIVSRSDVNMLATVNPTTKEVILTSIPRDYYVTLPSKGGSDKLTHSGLYGAEETVAAVEELMGIEINYYVKVNYSTVVKLVDAIGGIEIDSPYAFTTHGMSNTYTFEKGYNYLNGAEALAYSRERASWVDGDMHRNENQQLILEAILKKATSSTTILSEYTSILSAIKNNMETDMQKRDITDLIKMQLNDMSSWKIEKQALKGIPDYKECYALGFAASVVNKDETLIAEAVDKLMEVKEP